MKLNNVIIINRRHLRDFFSFREFWAKRKEFKDLANSPLFFKQQDNDPGAPSKQVSKNQLKTQVISWINRRPLTADKSLSASAIYLPTGTATRLYTRDCEKELAELSPEEAFGVMCLYELMERKLKPDIHEVLATLGHQLFDPLSGTIILNDKNETILEAYEKGCDIPDGSRLANILIANIPSDKPTEATLIFMNSTYRIAPGCCVRAVFMADKCLRIISGSRQTVDFVLDTEHLSTGIARQSALIRAKGNVLAFAAGRHGFLYSTDKATIRFESHHRYISDSYLCNPLRDDELIVYMELNRSESQCLLLTDTMHLYICNADYEPTIESIDSGVLMAWYEGDELKILKP